MSYGGEAAIDRMRHAMAAPCLFCDGLGYLVETETDAEHGCGGDAQRCAQVCPVPVERQVQLECPACNGTGRL